MIWAVVILSILVMMLFNLYRMALSETNKMRSMFVMAVLDSKFSQGQHEKIMDYLKSVKANSAIEVSKQFNIALDNMVIRLAKETPILLGAHAALWGAFKEATQEKAV